MRERILQINGTILILTLLLGIIGIAMLYSAAGGQWQPWAAKQAIRFGVGLILMFAIAIIPIANWYKAAYILYVVGLLLLVTVEILGHIGMGAQRWINIAGISLQPSEFMKLAIILALARYFHELHPMDRSRFIWLLPPLLLIALPAILILKQPNLGTATIIVAMCFAMWFCAGLRWRYIALVAILVAAAIPLGWNMLHDYQRQRIITFLDPQADPLGAGYNILQSIIAIGSGGLDGKGFMQGSQGQLDFLPEKHTDFIFTMVAEEFGFLGSMALLILFTLLLVYGIAIAIRARHQFGSLVAVGVTAMLWLHITINMAMVMGLIPVVGVPLPFLSYGGTMLLTTCMAIGLLQNIWIERDTIITRVL